MKTSLWRASYYQEWLIPLVSSVFYVHVFITYFFLLKGEGKYKRNHRTTASEYFFHPATLNETRTAGGVVFADTVFGYLVVQVKHSHGITFVPSRVASLHLVWSVFLSISKSCWASKHLLFMHLLFLWYIWVLVRPAWRFSLAPGWRGCQGVPSGPPSERWLEPMWLR